MARHDEVQTLTETQEDILEVVEVETGTDSNLVALRGSMDITAHDYIMQLSASTRQDKGIILECAVLALQAATPEQRKAFLMEVLGKRMSF